MLTARRYCASSSVVRRRACRLSGLGWPTNGVLLGCWRPEELGMNRKNQARGALIDRMVEARSEQEVEAAKKDAEGWLEENPGDVRGMAASEQLAETGARARDPERGAN